MIVVTGNLSLFGKSPATLATKLNATAFMNATTINVLNSTGWVVGDYISLSPSFS
jgi:hypothetical protein